jgi:hypothetical protein
VNQLDKSISTRLEATVTKQIQTQFNTSAKQALQVCFFGTQCNDCRSLAVKLSLAVAFRCSIGMVMSYVCRRWIR